MSLSEIEVRKPRRATLQDIATHVGVTVGTASSVLKGKAKERRISDDVVKRVLHVANEMDYAPNLLVRSLRHGQTHIISFFNGFRTRHRRDIYMGALTNAIERAGGSHRYDILVYCNFEHPAADTYRSINGGNNDGLIFFRPQVNDPLLPYLRKSNLPIVLLNATDDEGILSCTTHDWKQGIVQIADSLVAHNHRRIAVFTDSNVEGDAHHRVVYLQQCLVDRGIKIPEKWIVSVDSHDPHTGKPALQFLMSQPEPPTALFCWHDHLGYRILEDCAELGIQVPKQLSIVGYDGVRWPAKTEHVLASVHVDLDAMGKAAVDILVRLIEDGGPAVQCIMPVHFEPGTTLTAPRQ